MKPKPPLPANDLFSQPVSEVLKQVADRYESLDMVLDALVIGTASSKVRRMETLLRQAIMPLNAVTRRRLNARIMREVVGVTVVGNPSDEGAGRPFPSGNRPGKKTDGR
jgi:hypothetical protein